VPLTQTEIEVIEDAVGSGPASGASAPNGHNVQGAINVIMRTVEDMNQYALQPSDLPSDKRTEYEAAAEDLRHYRQKLATFFADELANELDEVEASDGTLYTLPDPSP